MRIRIVFILALSILGGCSSKEEGGQIAEKESSAQKVIDADCGNCGMPSEDYPKWRVRSYFGDRLTYFCSPKCFFLYQKKHQIADSAWVVDFYEVEDAPAKSSFYVEKSDVLGPMGEDFVPVATREAAQEFAADHHGSEPMTFDELLEK